MNAVEHGQIADNGCEVNGEGVFVSDLEIVCAAGGSGDAATDSHPPRRRIGKSVNEICAHRDGGPQHPSLILVGVPVPDAVGGLEALHEGAVIGDGVGQVRVFAAADVVTDDVQLELLEGEVDIIL